MRMELKRLDKRKLKRTQESYRENRADGDEKE
jgi:hypothetical protein